MLPVLQKAIPNGKDLPSTFSDAKKIIGKLGLSYVRIHSCENNCQLYRKEKVSDDFCSVCGTSRWKNIPDKTNLTKKERRKAIPRKVLWCFPIKPRLKRLFMHKDTATALRWHDQERTKDGALHHLADSEAWKAIDSKYKHIASNSRNMRFGIGADQVFYLEDKLNTGWSVVMYNKLPRDRCDTGTDECTRDVEAKPFHVSHLTDMFKKKRKYQHWVRSYIEGTIVGANDNALIDEEQ